MFLLNVLFPEFEIDKQEEVDTFERRLVQANWDSREVPLVHVPIGKVVEELPGKPARLARSHTTNWTQQGSNTHSGRTIARLPTTRSIRAPVM